MNISGILKNKGSDVFSTTPATNLAEASRVLTERGVGALLVTDEAGSLRGIGPPVQGIGQLTQPARRCPRRWLSGADARCIFNRKARCAGGIGSSCIQMPKAN